MLNPVNLHLAWKLKPLPTIHCVDMNQVAKTVGVAATLVLYFQLATTDANKNTTADTRILVGWLILVVGQVKFYFGQIKQWGMQYHLHMNKVGFMVECLTSCFRGVRAPLHKEKVKTETSSRRSLIDEYNMKYKEKFYKLDKQAFHPSNFSKVAPIEAFRPQKAQKDSTRPLNKVRYDRVNQNAKEFKPGQMDRVAFSPILTSQNQGNMEIIKEEESYQ